MMRWNPKTSMTEKVFAALMILVLTPVAVIEFFWRVGVGAARGGYYAALDCFDDLVGR